MSNKKFGYNPGLYPVGGKLPIPETYSPSPPLLSALVSSYGAL